jgi:hypothetical protein
MTIIGLNRTVLQHPFAGHFVVTIPNQLQWSQEDTKGAKYRLSATADDA